MDFAIEVSGDKSSSHSEVTDLHSVLLAEKNVVWLEVVVGEALLM